MQRPGKNIKGYAGETIDIEPVQRDCVAAAQAHGWTIEEIHPAPKLILGLTRHAPRNTQHAPRIYVSTGIHGDEPAGPLAARRLLQANAWPPGLEIRLCPCLNPTGFALNRRESRDGHRPQPSIPRPPGRGNPGAHRLAEAPAALRSLLMPPRRLGVARILPLRVESGPPALTGRSHNRPGCHPLPD